MPVNRELQGSTGFLIWTIYPQNGETERRREQGTRGGINGMLDYGYAILRSAILRSHLQPMDLLQHWNLPRGPCRNLRTWLMTSSSPTDPS